MGKEGGIKWRRKLLLSGWVGEREGLSGSCGLDRVSDIFLSVSVLR